MGTQKGITHKLWKKHGDEQKSSKFIPWFYMIVILVLINIYPSNIIWKMLLFECYHQNDQTYLGARGMNGFSDDRKAVVMWSWQGQVTGMSWARYKEYPSYFLTEPSMCKWNTASVSSTTWLDPPFNLRSTLAFTTLTISSCDGCLPNEVSFRLSQRVLSALSPSQPPHILINPFKPKCSKRY